MTEQKEIEFYDPNGARRFGRIVRILKGDRIRLETFDGTRYTVQASRIIGAFENVGV